MTKELRGNQKVKIIFVLTIKHHKRVDLTEIALAGWGDGKVLVSGGNKVGERADSLSSRVGTQKSLDNDN